MKHFGFLRAAAALLALMMLALIPAASLADVSVVSEQALERSAYLGDASNTYYIRVDGGYALFDAEGNQLSDVYSDITATAGGQYFRVVNESGLNNRGMLDCNGQLILPLAYGDIDVINADWILAYVLEETTDDNGDYHDSSNNQYNMSVIDVYYQGVKIGSLTRADLLQNRSIAAHGKYLYVRLTSETGYYLSSSFERTEFEGDYFSTSEFEEEYRKGVFHRPTAQQAFVSTCTLTAEDVEQAVWYDDKGNFVDLQGNVISEGKTPGIEYNSVSFYGNYFMSRSNDGKGIVALDGTEILEPVYDDLGGSAWQYFASGYQVAMRDGKLVYLNLAGEITASAEYPISSSDYRGFYNNAPFVTVDNLGQKIVITAEAGELPQRYQDAGYPQAGQRILAVKLDDAWGVIDLQGNTVIPFVFRNAPEISDDGTLVMGNVDGTYTMYHLAYTEEPAPVAEPEADGSWACPTCGETVTSNFCPNDGTARPAEIPTCSNCGYQVTDGNVPNFCPECGAQFE